MEDASGAAKCASVVDCLEVALAAETTLADANELLARAQAELAAAAAADASSSSDEEAGDSAVRALPAVRRDLDAARARLAGDAASFAAAFRPDLEPYVRGCAERCRLAAAAVGAALPEAGDGGTDSEDAATVSTDREGDDDADDADDADAASDAGSAASAETRALAVWPARSPASLLGPVLRPAAAQPPKPHVLSLCLFGTKAIYCEGAVQNARLAAALLPSFRVVVYCAGDVPAETLAALTAAGAEARLVSARCRGRQLALLRFLPCGDAAVDVVAVRDADSRLNPRDAAAVRAWLAGGKRFHVMHERGHDCAEILGGMWGVRAGAAAPNAPLPDLYPAMARFVNAGASSDAYGDDMAFLRAHVAPLCTASNVAHHSAGSKFFVRGCPFAPFPETPYRGTVGQPVNCPRACGFEHFLEYGCPHVRASADVTPELSARLRHQPDALAGIGAFLAGAPPAPPPPKPPPRPEDVVPPPLPPSHRRGGGAVARPASLAELKPLAERPGAVVVDLGAAWCGPCQTIGPVVAQLASDLAGRATFVAVDVDDVPGAAAEFGVATLPTFVVFRDGAEAARVVGADERALRQALADAGCPPPAHRRASALF